MEIYRWNSELLKQYTEGDLIALADSPDSARKLLRAELETWIAESRPYAIQTRDEGDPEEYDYLVHLFESDIAKEPTLHQTLWLNGSE